MHCVGNFMVDACSVSTNHVHKSIKIREYVYTIPIGFSPFWELVQCKKKKKKKTEIRFIY